MVVPSAIILSVGKYSSHLSFLNSISNAMGFHFDLFAFAMVDRVSADVASADIVFVSHSRANAFSHEINTDFLMLMRKCSRLLVFPII